MAEISMGTLYDFNKQAMAEEPILDKITLHNLIYCVCQNIMDRNISYLMLLNNERKNYTVFIPQTIEGFSLALEETLLNRGDILDISQQPDGNFEIWIKDRETKECYVYYLFDYTFGIVIA